MNRFRRICTTAMVSLLAGWISLPGFAQDTYPKPVSEYAEETAPGTLVINSYPKYYINAEGKLVLVNTTIVPSLDPAYDYEVIQGIYRFKVRKDGTFMVEHEGDVFTYKFNSIGIGRGSGFKPFELGQADFSRFIVTGDTIRWNDVYPDIDLSVRYIHDILKVDVIVKNAFMMDLKAEAKAGKLNKNDYLTARFDIPHALIRSQAKQNGQNRDMYVEALDTEQPIVFEKNGKTVHRLLPVETYRLKDNGEPDFNLDLPIRSAQVWNLKPNAPGVAEMSANVGDLIDLPEGDVVIDPSIIFDGEGFYGGGDIYDAYIDQANPNTGYGTQQYLAMGNTSGSEKRILFGFTHISTDIPAGAMIQTATLTLHVLTAPSNPGTIRSVACKGTKNWYMSTVTWNDNGFNNPPSSSWSGGQFNTDYQSPSITLPSSVGTVVLDIGSAFKSHYQTLISDIGDKGFLMKAVNPTSDTWNFYSTEYTSSSLRPSLTVTYGIPQFGADAGNGNDYAGYYITDRLNHLSNEDKLKAVRFFDSEGDDPNGNKWLSFVSAAEGRGLKSVIVFGAAPFKDAGQSPTDYKNRVVAMLTKVNTQAQNGAVVGVELGNEEEDDWWDGTPNPKPNPWFGDQVEGALFAAYYLEAQKGVRANSSWNNVAIIGGGSIEKQEALMWPDNPSFGSAGEFMKGFIQKAIDQAATDGVDKYKYMPDAFAIHTYTGRLNPEWYNGTDPSYPRSEMQTRINEMYSICDGFKFIPNFWITEYGFSPDSTSPYGPNSEDVDDPDDMSPSEYTQAVYYLRTALIHATSRIGNGIGWSKSLYWQHPRNGALSTGFFNNDNNDQYPYGTDRDIRYVSRHLFDPGSILDLGAEGSTNWIPFNTDTYNSPVKKAWCGWITNRVTNGYKERWAALWLFKPGQDHYYKPASSNNIASFTVSGDYVTNYTHQLYQFDFSRSPWTNVFYQDTTPNRFSVWYSSISQTTTFTINATTENPYFIRLIHQ